MGIITFPISKSGQIPLSNLIYILGDCSYALYLISGGAAHELELDSTTKFINITHIQGQNLISRALNYFKTQFIISYNILLLSRKVDIWIFLFGETLLFPMLMTKLIRKRSLLLFTGSVYMTRILYQDKFSFILNYFQKINYELTNHIVVYSNNIIKYYDLAEYKDKILINHEHFLDFSKFKITKSFSEREQIIGFVGRLGEEKGVMNLIQAIPDLSPQIKFFICGDGPLKKEIKDYIKKKHLTNVNVVGWVDHEDLPLYLNKMKVIVIPSFNEGLPNVLIEAMASGTVTLSTSVGSIPDLIEDGKNGFLMNENSCYSIANNIKRVLDHSELDEISNNAIEYVKKNFKRSNVTNKWIEMFLKIEGFND